MRTIRRSVSVVASVALITGVLSAVVTPEAFALTNVTASPSSSLNEQHRTVTVSASGAAWLPSTTQVQLVRHSDTSDTITGTVTTPVGPPTSSLSVDFDLNAAAPAAYDISVSPGTGSPSDTCTTAPGHTCFVVTSKAPTLTSMSPATSGRGIKQTETLTGTEFSRGAVIAAYLPGDPNPDPKITFDASTLEVASPTSMSIDMTVAASATIGPRTIRVTNTDGQFATCAGCLVVNGGPTVTSKSQSSIGQGANLDVTFNGSGFKDGATVAFSAAFPTVNGVTADNVRVTADGEHLTATVHVPSNEPNADTAPIFTSTRTVRITNPGAAYTTTTMTITTKPSASSVAETVNDGDPNDNSSIPQNAPARNFTITGSNIQPGATVTVSGSGVTVSNVAGGGTTSRTADFAAALTAATGARDVMVVNADGGTGVCAGCLTVTPTPTVTSAVPNTVGSDVPDAVLTVHGTNFKSGATVAIGNPNVHPDNNTVSVAMNGNSLTVHYSVDASPQQGPASVTVTNVDKGFGTCATCLFVQGLGALSVDETPVPNNNGFTQAFTIHGSGFDLSGGGPAVTLTPDPVIPGQNPIPVTIDTGSSSSTLLHGTANIQIAAPGTYDLDVVNPGNNADAGRCGQCVTINGAQPTLTSISAHAIAPGQVRTITIGGDDFSNGMTVLPGVAKVTAGAVTVTSPTTATATLTAASDAAVASHVKALSVKTADNQSNLVAQNQDLNVVAAPTLAMAWPATIGVGSGSFATFDAVVDNTSAGAGGSTFTGRIDFTLSGVQGLDPSALTFEYDSGGGTFGPVSLTAQPDGSITGHIPPQGGTALAPNASQTTHLRIKVAAGAPTGNLTVSSDYGDVSGSSRIDTVATDSDSVSLRSAPSNPLNVVAQPGNRRALVTWAVPTSDGNSPITGYTVTASPGGTTKTVSASTTSATITGLHNGTKYTFTVKATNAAGDSPAGGPSAAVTPHTPKTTVALPGSLNAGGAPAHLALIIDNDTITGYPKARVDFTITGPAGLSGKRVSLVATSGGGHQTVHLSGSGGTVRGSVPNSSTFALGEDTTTTVPFDLSIDGAAPSGTLAVTAKLVDASTAGSPKTLSSDAAATTVRGHSARFVPLTPREFVNSRTGKGTAKGRHSGSTTITVPGNVPTRARSVALDIHVDAPSKSGTLKAFPAGGKRSNTALSYVKGHPQSELTFTRMGKGRHVTLRLSSGSAHLSVDLLGYEVDSAKNGKRFISTTPLRAGDTRPAAGGALRIATVTVPSSVPAGAWVLVDVSAVNVKSDGAMKVYPAGASVPKTTALDFVNGEPDTTAYVVKLGPGRKLKVRINGRADALVDLLGYYSAGRSYAGRFRPVGAVALGGVGSSGTSTVSLPGVVPNDATSVLMTVTAKSPSSDGLLRAWATGTAQPSTTGLSWGKGHGASALVVSRVGDGGKVTFRVIGGAPSLHIEIIGYTTG